MLSTESLLFAVHVRAQPYKKRPPFGGLIFYGSFVDAGIPS